MVWDETAVTAHEQRILTFLANRQKYVLDDEGEPKPADLHAWAQFVEHGDRTLEATKVSDDPEVVVSTVFLGLSIYHMWETMIFGGPHDGYQTRHATRAQAALGHARAVVRALNPDG